MTALGPIIAVMNRAVVVTGARGFVGRALVQALLAQGYTVYAAARNAQKEWPAQSGVIWHQADLLTREGRAKIAGLAPLMVHCAWDVTHGAFWTSPANAQWHRASLDLLRRFWDAGGQRALCLGSCAEYEATSDLPWNEARPIAPATPYGAAKAGLHSDLQALGGPLIWARLFHLFGPGEDRRRFVPSVIDALQQGQAATVRAAQLQRDFASTGYVARAMVALLHSQAEGAFDIGGGRAHSLGQIAQILAQMINPAAVLHLGHAPSPQDPPNMVPSLAKLHAATRLAPEDTKAALAALLTRPDPQV